MESLYWWVLHSGDLRIVTIMKRFTGPGIFTLHMTPTPGLKHSDTVVTDVCVVGAGPAGLTFARWCIGSPFEVLVLEGGTYLPRERDRALQSGVIDSDYHRADALEIGRQRQFGGTANIWAHLTRPDNGQVFARAVPAETVDLEQWPIGFRELDPYYDQVGKDWIGRPIDSDVSSWSSAERSPLPLRPGPLTPIFASRVRCASRLQPESQISYAPSGVDEHGCWFWGAISLFRPQIFRGEGLEARWETC